jgi:hypothetical protein
MRQYPPPPSIIAGESPAGSAGKLCVAGGNFAAIGAQACCEQYEGNRAEKIARQLPLPLKSDAAECPFFKRDSIRESISSGLPSHSKTASPCARACAQRALPRSNGAVVSPKQMRFQSSLGALRNAISVSSSVRIPSSFAKSARFATGNTGQSAITASASDKV